METRRKTLSELNLIDNFLFTTLMDHEEYGPAVARNILEIILNRKVNVKKVHAEKIILPISPAFHGIRMDAVIEEGQTEVSPGEVFDVEPENKQNEKSLLPKRARYYHSRMDWKLLQAGARYDSLPKTWVIFITSFDPFGEGRMVYTIGNTCVELPEMAFDDGAHTLFLYINGTKGNPSRELQDLLHYIADTTSANAKNDKLAEIQSFVDKIKTDTFMKEAFMTWGDYIRWEREEAAEEAAAEATLQAEEKYRAKIEEATKERDEALSENAELKAELAALKEEMAMLTTADKE